MLFNALSTLAVAALAGLATAEPVLQPYRLHPQPAKLAKMSVRQLFGSSDLERRQDSAGDGYQPDRTFCGTGSTCVEACGTGYEKCSSTDESIHCFNPVAKQTCCPGGSGDSCDDGYFCSADTAGATWCCPNGLTYEECAKKYGVSGGLSSVAPLPSSTSTSAAATYSGYPVKTTSSAGSSTAATYTSTYAASGSVSASSNGTSYSVPKTSSTRSSSPSTTLSTSTTPPTTVASSVAISQGPAGALALLGAVVVAALF